MPITTITSRAFNQDTGGAKRAAQEGPVFITDRGEPAHVLLSIAAYRRLVGKQPKLTELLDMPHAAGTIDFDPPKLDIVLQTPDLS